MLRYTKPRLIEIDDLEAVEGSPGCTSGSVYDARCTNGGHVVGNCTGGGVVTISACSAGGGF